jgi:hypothetical protein
MGRKPEILPLLTVTSPTLPPSYEDIARLVSFSMASSMKRSRRVSVIREASCGEANVVRTESGPGISGAMIANCSSANSTRRAIGLAWHDHL